MQAFEVSFLKVERVLSIMLILGSEPEMQIKCYNFVSGFQSYALTANHIDVRHTFNNARNQQV